MPELLLSVNKLNGSVRRETFAGRDYLIAPVVAIVAGVLNGELVPAEEIGKYPEAWGGIPVPLGHPKKNNQFISANSPEIVARTPARFFNPEFVENKLRGEIWVDLAKAAELGGDAQDAVKKLEAGEGIEVSTAYYRDFEAKAGTLAGEPYSGIARNLRPDHLALLLHDIGSCSWVDGCGTPRVNQVVKKENEVPEIIKINAAHTGVMVALYPPADRAQALALSTDQVPKGARVLPANELHITLGYLGDVSDGSVQIDQGRLLEIVMNYAASNPIVQGRVSGAGRFNTSDPSTGLQAFYASYDCEYLQSFRSWLVDWLPIRREHGFIPHLTLAYIPVAAPTPNILPADQELVFDRIGVAWGNSVTLFPLQGEASVSPASNSKVFNPGDFAKNALKTLAKILGIHSEALSATNVASGQRSVGERDLSGRATNGVHEDAKNPTEEVVMEKSELITKLSANSRCPFDRGELEAMSETALVKLEKAMAGGCGNAPTANATAAPAATVTDDLADLRKLAGEIQAMGGIAAIQGAIAELRSNSDDQKATLVAELKANERCAFGEDELKGMSIETLRKLSASLRPASYAGRGAPRGNSSETQNQVPAAPAVLLEKVAPNGQEGK